MLDLLESVPTSTVLFSALTVCGGLEPGWVAFCGWKGFVLLIVFCGCRFGLGLMISEAGGVFLGRCGVCTSSVSGPPTSPFDFAEEAL